MVKRLALLSAAMTIVGFLSAMPTGLKAEVDGPQEILILESNREVMRVCTQALLDARNDYLSSQVKFVSRAEFKQALKGDLRQFLISTELREDLLTPTGVPFAFRDASHFLAYLKSNLFDTFNSREHDDAIAVGYGGFTQLFTKIAAVTEPKHLYGRSVSGDARAMLVYHEFGAQLGLDALPGFAIPDLKEDFDAMGRGHAAANIVEAPLGEALANGAGQNARFLSLASATVMQIGFRKFGGYGSTRAAQEKVTAWGRAAAWNCSRTNYQNELDAIARLKQAGLTVVPFNRRALVETSWRIALTKDHDYWTIDEFDRLEQLGGRATGAPLPSQVVAKLPPAQRRKADEIDAHAKEYVQNRR